MLGKIQQNFEMLRFQGDYKKPTANQNDILAKISKSTTWQQ
jgi:hypothetical protein